MLAETEVRWQKGKAMKILLSKYFHTIVWYNKKRNPKARRSSKDAGFPVSRKTAGRWADYARKHHTGDLLACQLIFLGAISRRTVDAFVQKVRDEIDTDQKIALPTERELEQAQGQDRIGTGLPTELWVKGV